MRINAHLLDEAEYVPTKKKGPGYINPKFIVMHYTAGWTTEGDVDTLARSSRKASAHLVVGRDGKIVQIVPFNERAWHAGPSRRHGYVGLNGHSIGIEISNAGWIKKLSNGLYQDQYGHRIDSYGKFIGIDRRTSSAPSDWHHEYHPRLARGTYAWEPFTDVQLDVLDDIVEVLLREYPNIQWIVSHEEIDTREWKTDPGPVFPMRRYLKFLEDRGAGDEDEQESPSRYRVTASSLRVRETPAGTVIGALKRGTEVVEVDNAGIWKRVEFTRGSDTLSGYVHADYLRGL